MEVPDGAGVKGAVEAEGVVEELLLVDDVPVEEEPVDEAELLIQLLEAMGCN